MCELYAVSSAVATKISFSLDEFRRHGGITGCVGDLCRIYRPVIPAKCQPSLSRIGSGSVCDTNGDIAGLGPPDR